MAIPQPGAPVRGSQSGAPIMVVFDLLGRRWAMGIIWNLQGEAKSFRELQAACESISPSILNSRLKDLREAQLIERGEGGYILTGIGEELLEILKSLGDWALQWAQQVSPAGMQVWQENKRKKKEGY